MDLMDNRIRAYPWGSRTAVAELLGEPSPSPHPQAELWIGAHPGDSSRITGPDGSKVALSDLIAADPVGTLGATAAGEFGPRLPFLLKVLAAAQPLSLQAHPSLDQAKAGFAAEERAGVALTAPSRNYKDQSDKPELICALTELHALCGFRAPAVTVRLLEELNVPALQHYSGLLSGQPDANGIRALFSTLMMIPTVALRSLQESVLEACVERIRAGSEFSLEYRTTLELGERYPGDSGVLASMLLNRVTLAPFQGLFLPAGNLHAYLSGVGVEIQANSDNVLRCGLTPKYADVPELMRVLDFGNTDIPVLDGSVDEQGRHVFDPPIKAFRLTRFDLEGHDFTLTHDGPQVVLVTEGCAVLHGPDGDLAVARGRSAWLSPSDSGTRLTGTGTAFLATDGL